MCGIVGIYSSKITNKDRTALISPMLETLRHRGPDGQSSWSNDVISLGHARLAVIDVSSNGQQPMTSHCGRYTITFNGEIYNFKDLRKILDGFKWRGTSDTEILLAAISEWGLDGALQKVNGMFAFGLWDAYEEKLFLVRDFLGEKPLYFYENEETVIFSSELRAIESIPEIELSVSRSALTQYLTYGNIPWPESIYNEVSKMQPGSYICFSGGSIEYHKQYFSLKNHIIQSKKQPVHDIDDGIDLFHSALSNSVYQRMESDVPLGAFLSGGTDSSLIVALMQEQSNLDVKTFSIGFDTKEFDEASDARAVAKHLGTKHTELYVSSEDSLNLVENLGQIYDEPFADSSQIPTLLVSKLARKDVTVCLSGDGGDELFSGYLRYRATLDIWSAIKKIPFRKKIAKMLIKIPPNILSLLLSFLKPIALRYGREGSITQKLTRFLGYMDASSVDDLYKKSITHWENAAAVVKGGNFKYLRDHGEDFTNFHEKMLYMDSIDYLEGDILQKVDRASMHHSLEVRVPMIDLNVIAAAWRIPLEVKVRKGISKWPLKHILGKYLPSDLVDKKKKGFGVPIDFWLRNQLKEWMQEHLRKETIMEQGVLDYEAIHEVMMSHLEGHQNNGQKLWDILMFQQWLTADPKRIQRL